MSDVITLETLDADGAIEETANTAFGSSRADFIRKAAIGTTGLLGSGVLLNGLAAPALAAPSKANDVAILNFALTLEYLESEFYNLATTHAGLTGQLKDLTAIVTSHEATHVKTLKKVLGSKAVKKPKFNFMGTTDNSDLFHTTAIKLEDTGVTAYGGQAANILQGPVLSKAAQILAIEARHAAAFRLLKGSNPAPFAFNPQHSKKAVLKAASKFIVP